MTARLTAISAGWAFSVSVRSLSGPSNISRDEPLAQRVVDLLEHLARGREGLGQRAAHADGLRALARKDEGAGHVFWNSPPFAKRRTDSPRHGDVNALPRPLTPQHPLNADVASLSPFGGEGRMFETALGFLPSPHDLGRGMSRSQSERDRVRGRRTTHEACVHPQTPHVMKPKAQKAPGRPMDSTYERKLTTILSADAVGYSRMMGADEAATLATLRNYRAAIAALVEKYRGRIVGTAGDSLLAEFASVVRGVECAVAMQREIAERNAALPVERQMRFRVGVNLGDVMVEKDDLYGDGVNIAARLQALAEPGGILISGPVFDQVRDKLSLGFDFLGDKAVKNIATEVSVYRVQLGQSGMAREQLQPGAAAPHAERSGARVSEPTASPAGPDQQARDERRHRLYISALRFGSILAVLLVINLLTWDGDFWFVWPALGLGLAFILHATVIFRRRDVARKP